MPRPMPSPRGTNIERLTMPGPVAAFDAALSDDVAAQLKEFLAGKLEDEDMQTVLKMLGDDDTPDMAADRARRFHFDYDAAFPNRNRLK